MATSQEAKLAQANEVDGKRWQVGLTSATLSEIAAFVNVTPAQGAGEVVVVSDGDLYSYMIYM